MLNVSIYEHGVRIAEVSSITVSMPRISRQQHHRANPEFTSIEDYFKKTVVIPFLDHLLSDLSARFSDHSTRAASLEKILPSNIESNSSLTDIQDALSFYSDDLPNSQIVDEEVCRWKSKWLGIPPEDRPNTLSNSLQHCCPNSLPNIYTLLKFFATLPLSSCSCERSASALRRLNNYLRCSQTEERLSALGLIHINYETIIDIDYVCKLFFEKHPRRLEGASLIFNHYNNSCNMNTHENLIVINGLSCLHNQQTLLHGMN